MVTEIDRWGEERNRQPEFFFNGIVGHVRSDNDGHINSWDQATRLVNYWRRFYNIPEVHAEHTSWNSSWHNYQQPSDIADRTSEVQEAPPESEMEDDASITANIEWHITDSKSDLPTGHRPSQHSPYRQGLQCSDP